MAILVTKELALVEDFEFGFNATMQNRGGTQFNSAYLPYSPTETVTQALDNRYTATYLDANFADINGNNLVNFSVSNGVIDEHAVNLEQLNLKADITVTDLKADKANVLELDNTVTYVPANDYSPSTKKFVDDSIFTAFQNGVNGSFTAQSGETITVTNGLITGII